ncbi:MAG TPA: BMP family ABC transporter substrate-binding protein [Chloroflexota bacterium]|jgi:basic membrane protein A|nr:BMP family ABC transporter substrate-binding protein [Chloroflexota bacterium]
MRSMMALAACVLLLAACAGDEDTGRARSSGERTPIVVENATPLALGRGDAAAVAATAAAQAAAAAKGGVGTSAPAGQTAPARPGGSAQPTAAAAPAPAKGAPAAPAGSAATKAGRRVGIVRPAWEPIRLREQDLNAQVRTVNGADLEEYQRNIDQLIRAGSNVIITVGVDLVQVTQEAAERNPDVKFIGIDQYQDPVLPNVVGLVFDDDQGGFLAGALAGLMTKSNVVGAVVGPGWMPTMINLAEGFDAGAKYVNPNVEVFVEYHPGELPEGLVDQRWGREAATQLIADGADVLFAAGGLTGQAALDAARTKNVLAIGAENDQYDAVPNGRSVLLTSVVKVVTTQSVQALVNGVADGSVKGGNVFGDVVLAPYREAEAKIPREVRERLQTIGRGLKQGTVKTGIQAH